MPPFFVLARDDSLNTALVSADQRAAAEQHGFTVVTFEVDAPTRGYARRAWDAQRAARQIEYSSVEDDGVGGWSR